MTLRDSLGTATTHPWSARYTSLLAAIITGRSAREAISHLSETAHAGPMSVVVVPSFVDVEPAIDLGRKGIRSGRSLLFPARVVWDGGPVQVLGAGDRRVVSWTLTGLGVERTGTTVIDATGTAHPGLTPELAALVPALVVAGPSSTRRRALAELDALVEGGERALWDARLVLEHSAAWVLRRTHAAVAREVTDGAASAILDASAIDGLVDELLLGDTERRISPAIDRLIERSLDPWAFARVDPQRLVLTALRSAAESAIRRRIGDPHIGRKIRALARAGETDDPVELLRRYRELWPRDAIGAARVAAALSASDIRPAVLLGDTADALVAATTRGGSR